MDYDLDDKSDMIYTMINDIKIDKELIKFEYLMDFKAVSIRVTYSNN